MAKEKGARNRPFAALKEQRPAPRPGPAARPDGGIHAGQVPARRQAAFARGDGRLPAPPLAAAPRPEDDASLFVAAVSGAQELSTQERAAAVARLNTPAYRPSDDELVLCELAALCEGEAPFRVHEAEEEFYGSAPGVSHLLVDRLRRGHYAVQNNLDLHGLVRQDAQAALARFISRSRCHEGHQCVLVVTGRGRGSPDGTSVLRESLPRWLSRAPIRPHVLAYATARAHDGGPGAYYVLLRRQGVAPFGSPVVL